jgi:hypothetical protein
MSRCRSCDVVLSNGELLKTKEDGSPEDLCNICNHIVFLDVNDLFMEYREYQFGDITDGYESLLDATPQLKINMAD